MKNYLCIAVIAALIVFSCCLISITVSVRKALTYPKVMLDISGMDYEAIVKSPYEGALIYHEGNDALERAYDVVQKKIERREEIERMREEAKEEAEEKKRTRMKVEGF